MAIEQSEQYIFLVDDEPIQNEMLKDHISGLFQYKIKTYESGEDAVKDMALNPAIMVLDFHLNSHLPNAENGVEVLKRIKEMSPATQVIMLSGQDKIEVAVDSMKFGAYDYVIKGETAFTRIENVLNKINERQNHIEEIRTIKADNKTYKMIIGGMIAAITVIIALAVFMVKKLDVSVPK
jgi:DNA-binding NtrC family response regulator